jgi:hypothetical protein
MNLCVFHSALCVKIFYQKGQKGSHEEHKGKNMIFEINNC